MTMSNADKLWKKRKDLKLRTTALTKRISELERKQFGKSRVPLQRGVQYKPGRVKRGKDLTPKMHRFVEEYPKDLHATNAAIRAGFAKTSAHVRGCQLLKDPKVVKALRREYKRITLRNRIEQDTVLKEISRIAYSNILDYCKWTNDKLTLVDSELLSRQDAAAIREVTETPNKLGKTIKIKLYDKPNALLLLCRYLGILDKPEAGEDPKDAAERIRKEMEELDNSIPLAPESEYEHRLDDKLNNLEGKLEDGNGTQ